MAYTQPIAAPHRIATAYQALTPITPADNTAIGPFQALWVGVGGNVALCPAGQTTVVTLVGVPSGTLLPVACQGVNATNTTATSIVGLG